MTGWRDILVYLDGSPRSFVTLAFAARLARQSNACLIGLHVIGFTLPTYDPSTYMAGRPGASLAGEIAESEEIVIEQCEQRFRAELHENGIEGEWHVHEGMVAACVAREARYVDLAIVTQVDPESPPLGTRRFVPQETLFSSGRPVLVLPRTGSIEKIGTRIVIGWNGAREAARAANDAMPFLEKAEQVTAVTVEPLNTYEDEGALIEDITPHLIRHGIKATSAKCTRGESGTSGALFDYAIKDKADLLVLGGYGHSRLRSLVLGGVSRSVLHDTKIPVLISH